MRLFDDIDRNDHSPASYGEGLHTFFNRVDGHYWDQVRDVLEQWFQHLPEDVQPDIGARFRNKNREQTYSAFWELYLHQVFRKLGYEVDHHPELPGTSNRPDFLLERNAERIYVKAVMVDDPAEERSSERVRHAIIDEINELHDPNFFLYFDVEREGSSTPPTRKLKRALERWLESLNPDECYALMTESSRFDDLPEFRWPEGEWSFSFRAIPKTPQGRGNPGDPLIGVEGPHKGRIVDDHIAIKKRLEEKASRYGDLKAPFVVAAYSNRLTTGDEEFVRAIFGAAADYPDMLRSGTLAARLPSSMEGLLVTRSGPEHAVSGVLTYTELSPVTIAKRGLRLWTNPWALHPLSDESFPFETARVDVATGRLHVSSSSRPAISILGLPDGWPLGEPFLDE